MSPLLLLLAVGCSALGLRAEVDEAQAREVLAEAVGLALSGQVEEICGLSPAEDSTCTSTLEETRDLVPSTGPEVRCAVPVGPSGPLRNGTVLVLEGVDAFSDPYVTEFIVYHDGDEVRVLDAVWWSGLSVQSYGEDTVTWRFDSNSTTCERGSLPPE